MTDLARRIDRAARHLDVHLDDVALRAGETRLRRRVRRRRVAGQMMRVAAACAIALGAASWWRLHDDAPPTTVASAPRVDDRVQRFDDGSRALLFAGGRLSRLPTPPREVRVQIDDGGARFEVARDPSRAFDVVAGDVRVHVVGTVFTVERRGSGARVAVIQGQVEVTWPGGRAALGAGDDAVFPPAPTPSSAPLPEPAPTPSSARPPQPTPTHRRAAARAISATGANPARDTSRPAAPTRPRGASAPDEIAALLAKADDARSSGAPARAVPALRTLVERHASDPRAPLAAFTLGRVLLEELHRPADAADAFARAQQLAPSSPLRADALAREAEASRAAGDQARAARAAADYLRRFPHGDKAAAMRRWASP